MFGDQRKLPILFSGKFMIGQITIVKDSKLTPLAQQNMDFLINKDDF